MALIYVSYVPKQWHGLVQVDPLLKCVESAQMTVSETDNTGRTPLEQIQRTEAEAAQQIRLAVDPADNDHPPVVESGRCVKPTRVVHVRGDRLESLVVGVRIEPLV